jgi:hypothetical protein
VTTCRTTAPRGSAASLVKGRTTLAHAKAAASRLRLVSRRDPHRATLVLHIAHRATVRLHLPARG